MRPYLCALACLLAAACATPQPQVVYREVKVPVSVPCRVAVPERPAYAADTVALDANIFDLAKALLVEREARKAHEAKLEAAAKSCS